VSNVPQPPPDPRRDLRVSHEDRDRVAEMLRDAAGEGRLDIDELEERLERALNAKTYGDLEPLVADLPIGPPPTASVAQPAATTAHSTAVGGVPTDHRAQAILSEQKRTGRWVVPASYAATSIMGSVLLDLRAATFAEPVVTISCNVIMGEVKIRVGEDVVVVNDVNPILGESDVKSSKGIAAMPDRGPVLRVRGTALLGSVSIERLAPGDKRLRRWRD
jgi:hypothetical protein